MSGWPHKDFALRIDDEEDGLPVVTIHFKEGSEVFVWENHRTGKSTEMVAEYKYPRPRQ